MPTPAFPQGTAALNWLWRHVEHICSVMYEALCTEYSRWTVQCFRLGHSIQPGLIWTVKSSDKARSYLKNKINNNVTPVVLHICVVLCAWAHTNVSLTPTVAKVWLDSCFIIQFVFNTFTLLYSASHFQFQSVFGYEIVYYLCITRERRCILQPRWCRKKVRRRHHT